MLKREHKQVRKVWTISTFFLATLIFLAGASIARADNIDDYIRTEMARQNIPGLSLAVVREGKVVKAQGYGLANLELKVPVTADTVFQLGSVGKQFTAGAVMLLVEEGKVGLDDPVSKHLPFAPEAWKPVTVRHLLTHTSGIKDYTRDLDFTRDASAEETAKKTAEQPLEFAPGEKWAYSNSNYLLLGVLIEKVSGKFYGDLLRERIFKPLDMTTARVNSDADLIPNRADGYEPRQEGGLRNQRFVPPTINTYADGSLVMSVRDMAKWDVALYGDRLFKKETRERMWTTSDLQGGKKAAYGFGWSLNSRNGRRVIEHGGAWQGFTANISRYVDDKLTVIVLINRAGVNPVKITHEIAGIVEPTLKPAAPKALEDAEPQVTALVRTVLEQVRENKVDLSLFAQEMHDTIKEFSTPQTAAQMKLLGEPTKLELLARKVNGEERVYQYRIQFRRATVTCLLTLTRDNKIAGLLLTPQE